MDEVSLSSVVRIGTVTAIDGLKVRVKFQDAGITSGWLYVLQRQDGVVYVDGNGSHKHDIQDTYSGGGSSSAAGWHGHGARTGPWVPKINDTVLCLYLPVFNGDGFVLGVI